MAATLVLVAATRKTACCVSLAEPTVSEPITRFLALFVEPKFGFSRQFVECGMHLLGTGYEGQEVVIHVCDSPTLIS